MSGLFYFYKLEGDELYSIDTLPDIELMSVLLKTKTTIKEEVRLPKHLLSHQTIFNSFIYVCVQPTKEMLSWMQQNNLALYSRKEIEMLPKPVLITRYLNSVSK